MTRCMLPSTLVGPAWTSWVAALHRQALKTLCSVKPRTACWLPSPQPSCTSGAPSDCSTPQLSVSLMQGTCSAVPIFMCSWCLAAPLVSFSRSAVCTIGFPHPFSLPGWCQHTLQHNLADLQDFESDPIPDLTKDVSSPPSGSPSWANQTINGFYFTPTLSAYPSFGTPGNNGTLALYAIDASRSSISSSGVYMAPACRFYMSVYIIPLDLPAVTSSQLYTGAASPAFSGSTALGVTLAAACAFLAFVLH